MRSDAIADGAGGPSPPELPASANAPVASPLPRPRSLVAAMTVQYAVSGSFLPFLMLHYRDQGLSYTSIGSILAVSAVFQSSMPLFWGMLADRFIAVNRLLTGLHLLGALAVFAFAFQTEFTGLIVVAACWHAFGAPTHSLLNALAFHNLRSPREDFGALRLWGSIGWMLPSVPIWFWLTFRDSDSLRFVFVLASMLGLAFVVISARLPHTPPSGGRPAATGRVAGGVGEAPAPAPKPFLAALRVLTSRPGFWTLLAVHALMFWSFSMILHYSPLVLESRGVERKWYGLIQCVGVVVEIPLFFMLRRFLGRLGYVGTLAIGCTLILGRQLVFAWVESPWILILSFALVGMAVVFYLIPVSLTVDALAGREVRATAQAMLLLAGPGLGQALGHLVSGGIADGEGSDVTSVFVVAAGVALVALALLPLVGWLERRTLAG